MVTPLTQQPRKKITQNTQQTLNNYKIMQPSKKFIVVVYVD